MKKLFLILAFFPILAHAQLANFTPVLVPVTTPTVVAQYTTITGMVATNPNAGTETPDIITFANLTGVITATSTGSVETSVDGGSTFGSSKTFSTGSPYTIELRIPAGTSTGSVTGTVTLTTPGGNTVTISTSGTVSAGPTLAWSPTTLTFTSTAGTQGAAQASTLSGTGLGSNNATIPATPTGYVDSIAGSTWLSTSRTVVPSSGSISLPVYFALSSSNSAGTNDATITATDAGSGVSGQTLTLNGTVSGAIAAFAFSTTSQTVPSGFVDVFGNPNTTVCSGTSNGVTVSSVATGLTTWSPYSTNGCSFDNLGETGSTVSGFPDSILYRGWFQYSGPGPGTYADSTTQGLSNPQLLFTGLNAGQSYTVNIVGSVSVGFTSDNNYHIQGAAMYISGLLNCQGNTSNKVTMTGVVADSNGHLKLYLWTVPGQYAAIINAITIQ